MKLFGITIGKKEEIKPKKEQPKQSFSLKHYGRNITSNLLKYEIIVVAVIVGGILGFTTLRMLNYTNPPADAERSSENLKKLKRITIDPKVIEKIKQLSDSETSTSANIDQNRNNPFSE